MMEITLHTIIFVTEESGITYDGNHTKILYFTDKQKRNKAFDNLVEKEKERYIQFARGKQDEYEAKGIFAIDKTDSRYVIFKTFDVSKHYIKTTETINIVEEELTATQLYEKWRDPIC
jgi:hypothetical protein